MALPQPSLAQLRPALELALKQAKGAPPGRSLPGPVRSLVRARRLPARWAVTMVQALDDDGSFRSWVAEAGSEESLGRVPWLWLARPEGWEDELANLIEEAAAAEELDKEVRLASERAAALERDLAAARQELSEALAAQSRAAAQFDRERRDAAREESDRRARLLSDLAGRDAVIDELSTRRAELEAERDALTARVLQLEESLAASEAARADAEGRAADLAAERDRLLRQGRLVRQQAEARRAEVATAVERAAAAAAELGAALSAAAGALAAGGRGGGAGAGEATTGAGRAEGTAGAGRVGGTTGAGSAEATAGAGRAGGTAGDGRAGGTTGAGATRAGSGPRAGARRAGTARPAPYPGRRPVELPPAVFEDSPEAAAHLVRVPGVHLVVDGYNVALTSWTEPLPDRPPVADLPALRRRLLDALGELVIRVQRTATVVFDGVDEGGRVGVSGAARRWLRVVFSASSVEADEVIVQAVRELPAGVPVVVATNDREVRDAVRALGANTISVGQLMSVLNRHTGM